MVRRFCDMVELFEYTLVVLVSTLLVGSALATYDAFIGLESKVEGKAAFEALVELASRASSNGTSQSTLALPSGTIACNGGVLSFSSQGSSESESIPEGCSFSKKVSAGAHLTRFFLCSTGMCLSVV